MIPGDREIPPGDVTWEDEMAGLRDEALLRLARGLDLPSDVVVASGGLCPPVSMAYYSFDQDPWEWPDNRWPRRFHPFPRLDQAARLAREARWRVTAAWRVIRTGDVDP